MAAASAVQIDLLVKQVTLLQDKLVLINAKQLEVISELPMDPVVQCVSSWYGPGPALFLLSIGLSFGYAGLCTTGFFLPVNPFVLGGSECGIGIGTYHTLFSDGTMSKGSQSLLEESTKQGFTGNFGIVGGTGLESSLLGLKSTETISGLKPGEQFTPEMIAALDRAAETFAPW